MGIFIVTSKHYHTAEEAECRETVEAFALAIMRLGADQRSMLLAEAVRFSDLALRTTAPTAGTLSVYSPEES
jgi:hypothetical protein